MCKRVSKLTKGCQNGAKKEIKRRKGRKLPPKSTKRVKTLKKWCNKASFPPPRMCAVGRVHPHTPTQRTALFFSLKMAFLVPKCLFWVPSQRTQKCHFAPKSVVFVPKNAILAPKSAILHRKLHFCTQKCHFAPKNVVFVPKNAILAPKSAICKLRI